MDAKIQKGLHPWRGLHPWQRKALMKTSHLIVAALFTFFNASLSYADLYRWVDKNGVLHIADSMKSVPEEFRDRVKVYRSSPPPSPKERLQQAPDGTQERAREEQKEELYGDHPLDWWKETFNKKRQDIAQAQDAYDAKRQFISLVDSGAQFGQVYGEAEIAKYSRYQKELPEDEKKVMALKDELSELVRKATIFGVPRNIRGE